MLIELKITNFRSFRDEQTFSLVASNIADANPVAASTDKALRACLIDRKVPGLPGVRVLKGAAIYGANASGKTNFIKAMRFITWFVHCSANHHQASDPTGAEPFKLDRASASKPSAFEITFVAENTRFVFGFSVMPTRVIDEYLVAYPKGVPQRWYHRTYNAKKNAYEWAIPSRAFKRDKRLEDEIEESALFLSVGHKFQHAQIAQAFHWFKKSVRFINVGPKDELLPEFTTRLIDEPLHHAKNLIVKLLSAADVGVVDVQLHDIELSIEELKQQALSALLGILDKPAAVMPESSVGINLTHKADGTEPVALHFKKEESAGTQRFFNLIGAWLDILDKGHTVFIDEIETSLQPVLVKELLKLLLSSTHNPNGAQVVFTTINPLLLDGSLLRRDQVWFTEKSTEGATHLYPLTDYQPRKGKALAKGYLVGRYGAIPYMPEALML